MHLNDDIVDIEKPDGICSPNFLVNDFLELFLHLSNFSINHSRSALIINGAYGPIWSPLLHNTSKQRALNLLKFLEGESKKYIETPNMLHKVCENMGSLLTCILPYKKISCIKKISC